MLVQLYVVGDSKFSKKPEESRDVVVCGDKAVLLMPGARLPLHWKTDGKTPTLVRVTNDGELKVITASLDRLGDGMEMISVERNEHAKR